MISTCHRVGEALCGLRIVLPPQLEEEQHKATAAGATGMSGRHLARRGPLCVGAAGHLLRKDENGGTEDLVIW